MPGLAVDIGRLWNDVEALSALTSGNAAGVTRLSFTNEDRAARDYLRRQMEATGLEVSEFAPGVMVGRLAPPASSGPPVMSGSHIDTVFRGGRFDGAVGVLGALEVARVLSENRIPLRSPYEVIVYPEEEGTRFGAVLTGSKAWIGQLGLSDLANMRDADGVSYLEAMETWGLGRDELELHRFQPGRAKALIELHIEQSVVLEDSGLDIGVVTNMIGIRGFDLTVIGVANHAGATPMHLRKDALAGAAEVMLDLERMMPMLGPHAVCTVGQVACRPGARNVIPGEVRLSIDFRDIEDLDRKWQGLAASIADIAQCRGLTIDLRARASSEPVALSPRLQDLIEKAATSRRLRTHRMPSGAVHDAQILAPFVDTGMIFIPSRGGRSHCPEEYSEPEWIQGGANVLLDVILALAA